MKSPLGKLRKFYKTDSKDKRDLQSSAQLDELAQAAKDMQDMRNCYDSLLSAAAATANSAYEFSESLREMGDCLLEKTALNDDEESGRVLLMLGKVQFELQKLVDSYRAHIFLTITNPSESLLNELRTVEDFFRTVYEYMVAQQKEKGKPKSGKNESFSSQQLRAAHDAYDEEATLCVFRLKSLKQGQSRSLLTQAARHHAAQLNFFRKGLKSLEAVEPHVRLVTEQQHIEYQFSGLEDNDGEDGEDNDENGNEANECGELSFNNQSHKQGLDVIPTSRNSMEMDEDGISSPRGSKLENAEMNLDRNQGDLKLSGREPRVGSYSAPIFAEKKFDPAEKARQLQQFPTRKSNTYVLPTPTDAKGFMTARNSSSVHKKPSGHTHNLWHSSPLEEKKHEKDDGDGHNTLKAQSVLKDSNTKNSIQLPPPLAEGLALPQLDVNASDTKKIKRQASSGPLTTKPSSTKPVSSTSGPIASTEVPQLMSGMASRSQMLQSSSPKISPSASPPLASSPRISELHELPRPPGSLVAKASRSPGLVGHSAPLVLRNQEPNATNRINTASPLPTPPLFVPRSFSIPSSSQREMALHVAKHFESPQVTNKAEDVVSPPLTPISLSNMNSVPTVSEVTSQSSPIQGEDTIFKVIPKGSSN
ncbi:hypothetical protein L484_005672 [Morus notabilis]|uniref:BAR domain-containing protein n=1 Tax=Morus notabilis TaxID=981085 RepID=W9SV71_9ROSA|nr:hypothetical protein L484_005672 [Morus notabilis]